MRRATVSWIATAFFVTALSGWAHSQEPDVDNRPKRADRPQRQVDPQRARPADSRGRRGRRGGREEGALKVGQEAPDFKLKSLDGESETELSSFQSKKPVILFFGSYT